MKYLFVFLSFTLLLSCSTTKKTDTQSLVKVLKLKNGKEVNATLATKEELGQAKTSIKAQGISFEDCCGEEACINGYIWTCSRANDNNCYWYKSGWKCN